MGNLPVREIDSLMWAVGWRVRGGFGAGGGRVVEVVLVGGGRGGAAEDMGTRVEG